MTPAHGKELAFQSGFDGSCGGERLFCSVTADNGRCDVCAGMHKLLAGVEPDPVAGCKAEEFFLHALRHDERQDAHPD
jgi:hypothetical protein